MLARLDGRGEEALEIHADCWPAVELFLALDTQWRRAGLFDAKVGLDYPAVAVTADMLGRQMTPELFQDLRTMELAALREIRGRAAGRAAVAGGRR